MNRFKTYGKGWHNESHRHSLASRGIKTSFALSKRDLKDLEVLGKWPKEEVYGDAHHVANAERQEGFTSHTFESRSKEEDEIINQIKEQGYPDRVEDLAFDIFFPEAENISEKLSGTSEVPFESDEHTLARIIAINNKRDEIIDQVVELERVSKASAERWVDALIGDIEGDGEEVRKNYLKSLEDKKSRIENMNGFKGGYGEKVRKSY